MTLFQEDLFHKDLRGDKVLGLLLEVYSRVDNYHLIFDPRVVISLFKRTIGIKVEASFVDGIRKDNIFIIYQI